MELHSDRSARSFGVTSGAEINLQKILFEIFYRNKVLIYLNKSSRL